jgi:hypothetical protein
MQRRIADLGFQAPPLVPEVNYANAPSYVKWFQ